MPDTTTRHACTYLAQPFDDEGNRQDRDHCTICGAERPDPYVAALTDIAEHAVRPLAPVLAAELEDLAGRFAAVLAQHAEVSA